MQHGGPPGRVRCSWAVGRGDILGHEKLELAERVLTAAPICYDPDLVVDHVYADSVPDYLSKVYQQEQQQPYLWQKQGHSTPAQWLTIVGDALNPRNYLGVPLGPALLNGAGTVAKAGGRISGMLRADTASEKSQDFEDGAEPARQSPPLQSE